MEEERKITLVDEDGTIELYVLEETRVNGVNYLLAADAADSGEEEDDGCYILKDLSKPEEPDALYEFVEDDEELDALMQVFSQLLDDVEIEKAE